MNENIEHYDTSDYPGANQFGIPQRNKKIYA